MPTITSANGVLSLVCPGVFPAPVKIQGWSTDKAWLVESVDQIEERIGVDGIMTAGFIFTPVPMTLTLMADSVSVAFFAAIFQAMKTSREVIAMSGTLSLPSTGENFVMPKGYLKRPNQAPEGARVLEAREYGLVWQQVDRSLL